MAFFEQKREPGIIAFDAMNAAQERVVDKRCRAQCWRVRRSNFVYWCVLLAYEKHRHHSTTQGRWLVFGAYGGLAPPVQTSQQAGQGDGATP